jgi:hypothetical protein
MSNQYREGPEEKEKFEQTMPTLFQASEPKTSNRNRRHCKPSDGGILHNTTTTMEFRLGILFRR